MSSPTLLVTSAFLLATLCSCRSLDPTSPRPIAFAVYVSEVPELRRFEVLQGPADRLAWLRERFPPAEE